MESSPSSSPAVSEYDPEKTPTYEAYKAEIKNQERRSVFLQYHHDNPLSLEANLDQPPNYCLSPAVSEYDPEKESGYKKFRAERLQQQQQHQDGFDQANFDLNQEDHDFEANILENPDFHADDNALSEIFLTKSEVLRILERKNSAEVLVGSMTFFQAKSNPRIQKIGLIIGISKSETLYNAWNESFDDVAVVHFGQIIEKEVKFNRLAEESRQNAFRSIVSWRKLMLKNLKDLSTLSTIPEVKEKTKVLKYEINRVPTIAEHNEIMLRKLEASQFKKPVGRKKFLLRNSLSGASNDSERKFIDQKLANLQSLADKRDRDRISKANIDKQIEQKQLSRLHQEHITDSKLVAEEKKSVIANLLHYKDKRSIRSSTQRVMTEKFLYEEEEAKSIKEETPQLTRLQRRLREIEADTLKADNKQIENSVPAPEQTKAEDIDGSLKQHFKELEHKAFPSSINKKRKYDDSDAFSFDFPPLKKL